MRMRDGQTRQKFTAFKDRAWGDLLNAGLVKEGDTILVIPSQEASRQGCVTEDGYIRQQLGGTRAARAYRGEELSTLVEEYLTLSSNAERDKNSHGRASDQGKISWGKRVREGEEVELEKLRNALHPMFPSGQRPQDSDVAQAISKKIIGAKVDLRIKVDAQSQNKCSVYSEFGHKKRTCPSLTDDRIDASRDSEDNGGAKSKKKGCSPSVVRNGRKVRERAVDSEFQKGTHVRMDSQHAGPSYKAGIVTCFDKLSNEYTIQGQDGIQVKRRLPPRGVKVIPVKENQLFWIKLKGFPWWPGVEVSQSSDGMGPLRGKPQGLSVCCVFV